MYPVICKIGFLTVYSYGLMLAIAFLTGAYLASRRARVVNLDPDTVFNLCFLVFISGIVGARLFYVGYHLSDYLKNPLEILMLQQGGLSWFGGLIAGTTAAIFYLKRKRLSVAKVLDHIAPYIVLAQAIGRLGCFLNGCCFGKASTLGVYFPVHEAVLIPTQLYSSLALVAIFMVLRFLRERPHRDGEIFWIYILLYCVKRFVIEFFRVDNPALIFGLTIFHFLSIAGIIVSVTGLILIKRAK